MAGGDPVRNFAALAACALILFAQAHARPDLILAGAVYTLDPARPWAGALVVRGSRIAYVGDEAGARANAGSDARVLALHGRMILPGFHDSHIHPMSGGMRLLRCRLGDARAPAAIYDAVRACAAARADTSWLLGSGLSLAAFAPEAPSLETLDALVPGRPAFLATEDGFTAWVNSRALAAAGLGASGETIGGLHRDPASGKPTGIVDGAAAERIRSHIPVPSEREYREALRQSTAIANGFGITSLVDASASPAVIAAYRAADEAGELTVRAVAAQRIDAKRGAEQADEMIARRDVSRGHRFRAAAAKIFLDGEIDQHTATMLAPYSDLPDARGKMFLESQALDAIVRRLDAAGFYIHMHAMGDGSVRAGLDAIERAIAANGTRDRRRHQLAHIGVADAADIARFGKLGVAANFQPFWAQASDPAFAPIQAALGPTRARNTYPIAAIAKAGGRVLASSDWPAPSMNPLEALQVAITRQPLDGSKPPVQPGQRATLAQMLAAYTIDAAWAASEEETNGSIVAGKSADLVILERNLFEVPAKDLHRVRVLATLLDGEPVYRAADFAWPQ